jgi:signal transduction histidine kinase
MKADVKRAQAEASSNPAISRSFSWLGFGIYAFVAVRTFWNAPGEADWAVHALLLVGILILMLSDPFLFRRYRGYHWFYFPVQTLLILGLGLLPRYQDIWGFLFYILCVQAYVYLRRPWPVWLSVFFFASYLLIMMVTSGVQAGLAYGLTIFAGAAVLATSEIVSLQLQASQLASKQLLSQQQAAMRQLETYLAQAEQATAAQEHNRLAAELHDAVGQTIFSIDLLAQSIHTLMEKDPERIPMQLQAIEGLTSKTLAQLRALIHQWRPPPEP